MALPIPILGGDGDVHAWLDTGEDGVVVLLAVPEPVVDPSGAGSDFPPGPGDFVGFSAKYLRLPDGRYCRCAWADGPEGRVVQGRLVPARAVAQAMVSRNVQPPEGLARECIREQAEPAAPAECGPLPALPELTPDLVAVHYSQELDVNSAAQTPPVSAVVVEEVLAKSQRVFSAFTHAEQEGWAAPPDFHAHLAELERRLLRDFWAYVADHPNAIYLHWGMRAPHFGFEVLAQRARMHKLAVPDLPPERLFDLAAYLKRRYGDNYVGHPRLFKAMAANGHHSPDLLDKEQAAAAWAAGEHGRLIRSLGVKVDAIADMYDAVRTGRFVTCPEPEPPPSGEGEPASAAVEHVSAHPPASGWAGARPSGDAPLLAQGTDVTAAADTAPATVTQPDPDRQRPSRKRRMTQKEANQKALLLAKRDRSFVLRSVRQWAKAIGCSAGLVSKLPYWVETRDKRRRAKGPGKGPKTISLTAGLEAVTGQGDRDEALRQLISEQEADYEPSPLEDDREGRRKGTVRARKRL